jgi:hypothetical protein
LTQKNRITVLRIIRDERPKKLQGWQSSNSKQTKKHDLTKIPAVKGVDAYQEPYGQEGA